MFLSNPLNSYIKLDAFSVIQMDRLNEKKTVFSLLIGNKFPLTKIFKVPTHRYLYLMWVNIYYT